MQSTVPSFFFLNSYNGITGTSFEANFKGSNYNYIFLDLDSDGNFTLQVGSKAQSDITIAESFQGTYFCKNSTLLLTYNGENYPLIMNNANYIFFLTYDKTA